MVDFGWIRFSISTMLNNDEFEDTSQIFKICVISRMEKLAVHVFSYTNITFHIKGMWLNSDKCKSAVPGLRMLREENYKFKASLGYKQDLLFLFSNPHPLHPRYFTGYVLYFPEFLSLLKPFRNFCQSVI